MRKFKIIGHPPADRTGAPAEDPSHESQPLEKQPTVYIMSSGTHGTVYVGVTSDIAKREDEHRRGETNGFAARYKCTRLVWMESHATMEQAIAREKRLKHWNRAWKIDLIEATNPYWKPIDFVTGKPVTEEQMERNMRGGWVDEDGNVIE